MKRKYKNTALFISAVVIFLMSVALFYSWRLPSKFYIEENASFDLDLRFSTTSSQTEEAISAIKDSNTTKSYLLKLFGIIPIKEVTVIEKKTPYLICGGMPIGIKILSRGVIVVELEDVICGEEVRCPARECGIRVGDNIISVDGKEVNTNQELADQIMKTNGKKVVIKLIRNSKTIFMNLTPVYSAEERTYKAGVWVRDSSAGIGTVTFINPENNSFAALGHPVCDRDSGEIFPLSSGEITDVKITNYHKGEKGCPGELIGIFTSTKAKGILKENCDVGIYGTLNEEIPNAELLPMAFRHEVKTGKAQLITTIDEKGPKEYEIEIERIDFSDKAKTKNLVIKVTDKELLLKTGGILQGMSGSPVIQNGKLVGAVTHVLVNDPTRGYGIFAENMFETAQSVAESNKLKEAS